MRETHTHKKPRKTKKRRESNPTFFRVKCVRCMWCVRVKLGGTKKKKRREKKGVKGVKD